MPSDPKASNLGNMQASNKFFKKNYKYEPKDFCQDSTNQLGLINESQLGDE